MRHLRLILCAAFLAVTAVGCGGDPSQEGTQAIQTNLRQPTSPPAAASTTCDPGFTLCGTQCVNLNKDEANCGECGFQCGPRERCFAGQCECVFPGCP